jgi:hypothetical protein
MFNYNPAQKRYQKRIIALSLLYAAFLIGVTWLFRHSRPEGPPAWLLALLPALPLLGIFAAMGRYLIEEGDEYLRALETRKSLIASGFMLSVTTCWGFLQSFDLVSHVDFYWAAVLWFAGLGLGGCVQALRK